MMAHLGWPRRWRIWRLQRTLAHCFASQQPQACARVLLHLTPLLMEAPTPSAIAHSLEATQRVLVQLDPTDDPELWGTLQLHLGHVLVEDTRLPPAARDTAALRAFTQALTVFTETTHPDIWASLQQRVGNLSREWVEGDHATHVEQAIACYEATLRVRTEAAMPLEWAATQLCLGLAYHARIFGDHWSNIEQAIDYFAASLRHFTFEWAPTDWARARNNLARSLAEREVGEREDNLDAAETLYVSVLRRCSRWRFPTEWADAQSGLGTILLAHPRGRQVADARRALVCFRAAQRVFRRQTAPFEWATIAINQGNAWGDFGRLGQSRAWRRACQAYRNALAIWTLAVSPERHRFIQLNLAFTCGQMGAWQETLDAAQAALSAEAQLLDSGGGAVARDKTLRESHDAPAYAAYALTQLGQPQAALLLLEATRQRGTLRPLAAEATDESSSIAPTQRSQLVAPRQALGATRRQQVRAVPDDHDELASDREPAFGAFLAQQQQALPPLMESIPPEGRRQTLGPEEVTWDTLCQWRQALDPRDPTHACVWLCATPWGGLALALTAGEHLHEVRLPALTTTFLDALLAQERAGGPPHYGGYGFAQEFDGWDILLQDFSGATLAERIAAATREAQQAQVHSQLVEALGELATAEEFIPLLDRPFEALTRSEQALLATTLNRRFLQREAQHAVSLLMAALRPLDTFLRDEQIAACTLIPSGALAAFPLTAMAVLRDEDAPLALSVAPSVRALMNGVRGVRGDHGAPEPRRGLYTVGNPLPSAHPLPWGEAEAQALAYLTAGTSRIQLDATRAWLLTALREALVVDICCHGRFAGHAFLQSQLRLAGQETLTLGELLLEPQIAQGMRLVMLSACQTAMVDMRGARDEVRSWATAFLEVGAAALLGALWPVDDEATYCLALRFVQVWWSERDTRSPAAALCQAQRWLRQVTYEQLVVWHAALPEAVRLVEPEIGITTRTSRRLTVRHWGRSADDQQAIALPHATPADGPASSSDCPYADPYYWAGWELMGW